MSVFIGNDTRLVVQGITGRDGSFHAKQMLEYGTRVVAGVPPGKGGQTFAEGVGDKSFVRNRFSSRQILLRFLYGGLTGRYSDGRFLPIRPAIAAALDGSARQRSHDEANLRALHVTDFARDRSRAGSSYCPTFATQSLVGNTRYVRSWRDLCPRRGSDLAPSAL